MTLEIISALIVAAAILIYTLNLKDVYYGYGQAVTYIHNCDAKVTYENGMLSFDFPNGNSDNYMCSLGNQVYKLLVKNGHIKPEQVQANS